MNNKLIIFGSSSYLCQIILNDLKKTKGSTNKPIIETINLNNNAFASNNDIGGYTPF